MNQNENLTVTKESAVKAYEEATRKGKLLLENLYGKRVFQKRVFDRIKSFADACEEIGVDPSSYEINSTDQEDIAANALRKLRVIAKALNEGWSPDFSNSNERKLTPYFKWSPSAGAFVYYDFGYWNTATYVGSRLVFRTPELAKYAGEQFIDIYNEFLN